MRSQFSNQQWPSRMRRINMRNLDTFGRIGAGMPLLLGFAALYMQPSTHAVVKSALPSRAYYLTKTSVDGAHALSACSTG